VGAGCSPLLIKEVGTTFSIDENLKQRTRGSDAFDQARSKKKRLVGRKRDICKPRQYENSTSHLQGGGAGGRYEGGRKYWIP